eukprot:UN09456
MEIIWWCMIVIKTSISWYWDVFKDWKLMDPDYGYLRKVICYPKQVYYFIVVYNLIARFTWTRTLAPEGWGFPNLNLFFAGCEILRRMCWSILRVEKEILKKEEQKRLYR